MRLRIAVEQIERINEGCADNGIASDSNRGRLSDAALSELSAVRSGVGSSIFNAGTFENVYPGAFAEPLLIEPPIFLTCSLVSSGDFPLTHAGEAVKNELIRFMKDQIAANTRPGAELIA